MITVLNILRIGTMLLSAWLIMHAMSALIEISGKRPRRLLMFVGCFFLGDMAIFIGDPFNVLSTTLVFLIIVFLTCKGSFWQKLTIGLMFSSTVFSFNALRDNYIYDLLPEVFRQVEHGFPFARLFNLPFAMVLYLCSRKFAPDKDYALSDSMWKLLFLLTITPLGIVLDVVTLFRRHDISIDAWAHQEYAVLLIIALLAFISLLWCVTVLARQQKLEQQSMFTEINRKYYEAMEQQHFELRRLKHDLANHMQVLSTLPEDKRQAYALELAGSTALSQSFSYSGDPTVNAVLTVKKGVMERCQVRLETDIDIPLPLPYDKTDICALYANALDNAMEACLQLKNIHKEISLKSKAGKGLFCLEVRNPASDSSQKAHSPNVETSNPGLLPPTSKPDKVNHGLGLKSIQEIVTRYHGHMEIKIENGIFDLFLYLPLPS